MTQALDFDPSRLTVLIVDDEVENAEVHGRALRGYRTLFAHRGDEAMAMLAEHAVDIVVTDERMPGVNGSRVLERARATNPIVRRVIVSAYAEAPILLEAINRGEVERYLLKPLSPQTLRAEVDALAREYLALAADRERVALLEEQLSRLHKFLAKAACDHEDRLEVELARAERYGRPLSVLVTEGDPDLAVKIAPWVREVDLVVATEHLLVVVLPEATTEGAEAARKRLAERLTGVKFRLATYPTDGRTAADLCLAAR